ncbi:glucose-6-phosphate 1-dehydrogenase [Gemmobacter megaterium]|uniref:Glucose-6-phosphate 1-dehydrogenase n=1 Tax=Gemmobacter megaterium TaxID=1086013 RepID=A0A1N7P9R0_9RHOB|nr:glucose-6-phosphate dehydrogenase [Gemmobacter megaterium]GGE19601.1 glucose-6-phosphate 1-dehydrogenase [Gemmobacter megaterium]SIT07256.1 glucose-6-phosphate 1-dehydrogenase [Gemmobacter megaterium]
MVSRVIPVEPFDLVVFGATGDLARRKILPGLYRRWLAGQIPEGSRLIGAARSAMTPGAFRAFAAQAIDEFVADDKRDAAAEAAFLARLEYVAVDAEGQTGWRELAALMRDGVVRAFYFSVAPALFGSLAERLKQHAIADDASRVVVEKPFGSDLETARALNATLARHFQEAQIYRIDHYLGKETVQNLMAVRFANILFEPLWNAQYVDHVQITVAETVGVAGRASYYDKSGAMRDMVQNHMMQLLCLIAMEPPYHFDPDAVRDEKLKVIRALDPVRAENIVRGQYLPGAGQPGYLEDVENPESQSESFVALQAHISNWRWKGTPFYLRTGKRLRARVSEIAVTFKEPPHSIFDDAQGWRENVLVIRLQPDEGMNLKVMIKEPGPGGMRLVQVPLDMSFAEALGAEGADMPDAYERLIMDVIRGNQTLFMRGDEVEAAWAWTDPVIDLWDGQKPHDYEPGTSGPEEALMLMHRDGRRWREIR